jgi:hypothetical protein
MTATFQMVGNWSAQTGDMLERAIQASIEITGRTAEQACRHAVILMAESARKLAKKAPARRPVLTADTGGGTMEYVKVYRQGKKETTDLYKWKFDLAKKTPTAAAAYGITGTWDQARRIGNRGLAGRSWMWGLKRLGGFEGGKGAIPGTSNVYSTITRGAFDYVKENKLDYIEKAMPAGWESMVRTSAGNKIMFQAANKIESKWKRQEGAAGALGARRAFESFAKKL